MFSHYNYSPLKQNYSIIMSLQVSTALVFPRFPGSENPCQAWRAFYRNLIDTFARAPVLSQHSKGLLGALLTTKQYAALPGVPFGEFYEPYLHPDVSSIPRLRFTQELTTFTNLYGKFYTPFTPFTPLYAPLQITFCKTTTQISDHIDLVLALSRSRSDC